MSNITIISSKPINPSEFMINDFYDSLFSYKLNNILLYSEELEFGELVDSLREDDYVEICIKCNNVFYKIYHCFSNDKPIGLIVKDLEVLEQIGENVRKLNVIHNDANVFVIEKWYYDLTKNCNDYVDDFWYV